MYHFYSVIIGTELLNQRREDQHFSFLNSALHQKNLKHQGNFVIDDTPALIEKTFTLIKEDPKSVLFSFGGIGSTPDDYTRQAAANVFSDGKLVLHQEAKKRIEMSLGDKVNADRLKMGEFPKETDLLHNVINNIPGFSLHKRFFFMPGFPSMSHPMVEAVLEEHFQTAPKKYRRAVKIETSEGYFLSLMQTIPNDIEFSSLPHIDNHKREVEISFASYKKEDVDSWIEKFISVCHNDSIAYEELKNV